MIVIDTISIIVFFILLVVFSFVLGMIRKICLNRRIKYYAQKMGWEYDEESNTIVDTYDYEK